MQRESLLNAPALMFMSAVLLVVFWVLFPRQPAFRNPSNLSANDALSVAYLRVLVQSDPANAPLRLSFVQLLTQAGATDEAVEAIGPLQRAPESNLTYEIRLAELKLSLQQLYRQPAKEVEARLRARIAELIPSLLRMADNDEELSQVVVLAEQFGEPSVLAETFEQLPVILDESDEKKSRWLAYAAKQRIAAAQPRLAARNWCQAFSLEQARKKKMQMAKFCLRAYLQAGIDHEAIEAAVQVQKRVKSDAELLLLSADIAEPLEDHKHALEWLEKASTSLHGDTALAERIVRLQVSMGLLAESFSRAAQLRTSLVPGSDLHKLIARIYDWNAQPDEALVLWLSFARHRADQEAETRAFALAQAKPDNEALLQLLEAIMARRTLTAAEAEAYVKAGLSVAQPSHLERQLRRHAERFDNPPAAMKALANVLILQGKPSDAIKVYRELPDTQDEQQRVSLARLYDEAGDAQKSFDLLTRNFGSPDPAFAEEYWVLLAKVATQLGQDTYASKAYEEALAFRPNDAEILDHLQRLAVRHGDHEKSERLARYGWDRLRRVEDLQRLMRFAWKREEWQDLDHLLSLGEAVPSVVAQAPDYWYFRSMRKMATGDRDSARQAMRELLRLRGSGPEVAEAMIWLLLSDDKIDQPALEAVVQPYRSELIDQSVISPPLVEALAAAEHTLGKPVQAASWYLKSLATRPRDFLWTLTLADNMEWVGCPAHANHARYGALKMSTARRFAQADVKHPQRLAEYVAGSKDSLVQRAPDDSRNQQWRSLWERWGFTGRLDNASYFALQRQRERLLSPAWDKFAEAVNKNDEELLSAQLAAISLRLQNQPDDPALPDVLPLSMEDLNRANRWFAGEAPRNQPSLDDEPDICRATLAKIRESQGQVKPGFDAEPAKP